MRILLGSLAAYASKQSEAGPRAVAERRRSRKLASGTIKIIGTDVLCRMQHLHWRV